MDMGKLEAIHKLTAVRKLCGQVSGEPKGVLDQSFERMNLPFHRRQRGNERVIIV